MMTTFTGVEYLLIDVANQFGLDKELFEPRLQWAKANLHHLESLADQVKPKKRPLYQKACLNIRRAQAGKAIGAMVGFDASCSGIQVMSALTGCKVGAYHTGLVDPNYRADAYQTCTDFMSEELGGFSIERDLAKQGLMTTFYGSSKEPETIFGKGPELNAFYAAAERTAPGAWKLLQELLAAWQPFALVHEWRLPDGFLSRVRVKEKVSCRPKIDELGGKSFTYVYKDYRGTKTGISLPANVTHSTDGYVLRSVVRRCNYDPVTVDTAMGYIEYELKERKAGNRQELSSLSKFAGKIDYYKELYEASGMPDVVILPHLLNGEARYLSTKHLEQLHAIGNMMLQHEPFEVVTIHDDFKCHPNNMNHLRMHYREIFAQIAESTMLEWMLNQITGQKGTYKKHCANLGDLIRQSNYAIC